MEPRTLWHDDSIFIEIGATGPELALSLRRAGYSKYLGVCSGADRVAAIEAGRPEVAGQFTSSRQRKLVLNNNAQVLILSGLKMLYVWRYRAVRHAQWVAWPCRFHLLSLLALVGCLMHLVSKRYSVPRVVTLRTPDGRTVRLLASRVRRQKYCRRGSLHFIPHEPGLPGFFRQLDEQGVRYVVLRWFESLPEIGPNDDLDLLVADRSLDKLLGVLESLPGIQPCDVYSESGLARSAYCGTPYYPAHVARRILDGAVRYKGLCLVPNAWDYFHSLAYHAVYHKGTRSNLPRGATGLTDKPRSERDFAAVLRSMADRLSIDVDISLEGLQTYLQETGWGPSPEMLARLAVACWRSKWLQLLAEPLPAHVHDQGLTAFVLRRAAVEQGFQDQIIRMIRQSGFEILATKTLSSVEVEHAAARTRGGNWEDGGPFDLSGGGPAVAVIAYDHQPLPPNRKQRRRFPQRTNARIFVKEAIRDAIIAQLPPGQGFNALHSSDHAAEAWHMIEVLAPDTLDDVRARLQQFHHAAETEGECRQAA